MRALPLAALVTSCAVAGTLTATLSPAAGSAAQADPQNPPASQDARGVIEFQTSDRVQGESAPRRIAVRVGRPVITNERGRMVARGVRYKTWRQQDDPARDSYRVHVIDLNLPGKNVSMDLASDTASLAERRTVPWLVDQDTRSVAGVNGDFFDISDTGAPLGNSQDAQRNLVGARRHDWLNTFTIDRNEVPRINRQRLVASITQYPNWEIAHFNSPTVFPDKIGIYTRAWGRTLGDRVTDGRTAQVREVLVRNGRVIYNRSKLSNGMKIRGRVLIGRGTAAQRLAKLRVGSNVGLRWQLGGGKVRVAISGNRRLLHQGKLLVRDDIALHPRTAVGINRDNGHVLLVAVDGRSESSSGTTMRGLGELMRQIGADDALNLDGGGSTTMVGLNVAGQALRVFNDPSDGQLRRVPNGLTVLSRPLG